MDKKILFVTEELSHYRIPLFKKIMRSYNLVIAAHKFSQVEESLNIIPLTIINLGPLKYFRLPKNLEEYSTIIFPFNLRILNLYLRKKSRSGLFGIGVRASLDNKYDSSLFDTLVRRKLLNKFDFAIFYDDYPKIKYQGMGIDPSKLFVAHNTIEEDIDFDPTTKSYDDFLFIGSLYAQKGIFRLLKVYLRLNLKLEKIPILNIVGDGPERGNIESFIHRNKLDEKVILHGNLESKELLRKIFQRTCVTISPNQAGLSVLTSFSYSTGFITSTNAITGGERFNIIDGWNGEYFNSDCELLEKLELYLNKDYAIKIGVNSYEYYSKHRSSDNWKNNFIKAL